MIYQPEEDSFLLEKYVRKLAYGRALDMGTGTGILAKAAVNAGEIIAVDINENAVEYAKNLLGKGSRKNVKVLKSDLFSNVKGKFDVIIFNPPYLPNSKYNDVALDGGKRGYEVIERFLKQAGKHLNKNGFILLLYSSLSKPRKIKQIIKQNGFVEEVLEEKKVSFERLFVVKLSRKSF